MPFSGPDDDSLPDRIKEMAKETREKWVGAWNGAFKNCRDADMAGGAGSVKDCEGVAFRIANSAVSTKDKCYETEWRTLSPWEQETLDFAYEVQRRRVDQPQAEYQTLGGTKTKACANCQFFIPPNDCSVVVPYPEPIVATGLSIFWAERVIYESKPLEVVIVEAEDKARDYTKVVDFFHNFEHDPDGLNHCVGSDANPYEIKHLKSKHVISIKYARGHGRADKEQWFTFSKKLGDGFELEAGVEVDTPEKDLWNVGPGEKAVSRIVRIWNKIDDLLQAKDVAEAIIPATSSFKFHKQADGTYRWVAIVSNHFRDKDNPPEILTAKAHRDFVAYLDKGGEYPETWLWHTPGTRWGKADFADFADGFLVMSGTVDDTKEALAIAESLAATEGLKVSHGFQQVYSDFSKGLIGYYRTFEISPLPAEVAANPWTGIEVLKEEAEMGFEQKKREFLVTHMGEEKVASIEGNTASWAKALEDLGIEYKDADGDKDATPDDVVANILVQAITASDPAEAAKAAALVVVESEGFKAITTAIADIQASVKAVTDQLPSIQAAIKELQKSDDEKIAATLTSAASKVGDGFQASKDGKEPTEDDTKDGPKVPDEWPTNLQNMVVSSIGQPSA